MNALRRLSYLFAFVFLPALSAAELFDGKTLAGWEGDLKKPLPDRPPEDPVSYR